MESSDTMGRRELEVVREITGAFLEASKPLEVYRLALSRLLPLVRASFASVFLEDDVENDLLRLVCAQNWPQSSARFLSQLRIRVGRGPTGRAVAENRPVAVEDIFADPTLREWWEPAHELGFAALIALPLTARGEPHGALSFYFDRPHAFREEEKLLLVRVAEQLSATAERSHRMEQLELELERLRRRVAQLELLVEDAAEARRLKDEFLANMSHELRTPLTSILGYTHLLLDGSAGSLDGEQENAIVKIGRAGTALQRLISDLLELSQLKLGRAVVEAAPTEALALCRAAIDQAGDPPEGVELQVEAPDGAIPMTTDREKVVKILENLLSNAFKFTPRGRVDVVVRQRLARRSAGRAAEVEALGGGEGGGGGRIVEWIVRDSGIGIEAAEFAAIFDEFRQVDGSSTRLYGGTGLGLALSLRLARLLGGDIVVESEPGDGSTFTLSLPAVAKEHGAEAAVEAGS